MRYIGSIIFLAFIGLLVFGAIEFKESSSYYRYRAKAENFIQYIKEWFKVKKHNVKLTYDIPLPAGAGSVKNQDTASIRKPPLSLMLVRTKLENFFPDSFVKELDQQDWDYIFSLIYEPVSEKQGDFEVKRYLSQEEIEQELIYQYRFPFARFQRQHWDYFWNVVSRNG
ncbi:MAG: hypothetical protein K9L95_02635 [Candidatus Omnitrophica bacterium]|nr:hypothetical protein [Candidatus Omnitrophota bacterium]MCF7877012.1 hypothetical protein [Candidatus Omnitrophota bacterium]MCF7878353.1 hypothetical protein [Candidatus Omnitrophota bacterium]MCF7893027.1 hypothetical protein [Candidatus Omnitrophota bacterium]